MRFRVFVWKRYKLTFPIQFLIEEIKRDNLSFIKCLCVIAIVKR